MLDDEAVVLWRAFVPRWAYLPLSGEGAARFGGRWNPPGAPTIYAARELSTAWAEYNQNLAQHPALIARLELSGARIADLTDGEALSALGVDASIHSCEWRHFMDRGDVPPTWRLREALLANGWHGVAYPSFMSPGGSCVALWKWNAPDGPRLDVIDPEHRLPNNPTSWL